MKLNWQSKLVLMAVMPFVGAHLVLEAHWWALQDAPVAIWTLGVSALFGLVTWRMRAATPWASATGAAIVASLMFSTVMVPYLPWRTALVPVLAVVAITLVVTHLGRAKKERLGMAESRKGRDSAQIAANLGFAAIAASAFVQSWLTESPFNRVTLVPMPFFALALASLAEAAADTASSEVGQAFGGRPRMITTLRQTEPGTDGAISPAGTLAGIVAALLVVAVGTYAMAGDRAMFAASAAGGVFGLLFDSLLGATLERRGWLNNDLVNCLSTIGAAFFALVVMVFLPPTA
jgi:uncharacterized protein (TIGR00297 family)